jgi:ABC-2 type transport system permease protein
MHAPIVAATAIRVVHQLRRDARTVALLLFVPLILIAMLRWVFAGQEEIFQRIGVPLLGIFPLISMFLVTSITMLRERTSGTLERLMTMPLARGDLLLGYAIAFGGLATLQVAIASSVAFGLLGLEAAGPTALIVAIAIVNAVLGMALGLFVSAFARTEFQAVQFMPAFIFPQVFLCGLFAPRDSMATGLEWASNVLPMTYAYDALVHVAAGDSFGAEGFIDVSVVLAFTIAALAAGAATLPRRTP